MCACERVLCYINEIRRGCFYYGNLSVYIFDSVVENGEFGS